MMIYVATKKGWLREDIGTLEYARSTASIKDMYVTLGQQG